MRTTTLRKSVKLQISPLIKNFKKVKSNEVVWLYGFLTSVEVAKVEIYRSYVIAVTVNSERYSIYPKNSKITVTTDSLEANCSLKQMLLLIETGQIKLTWKRLNNLSYVNDFPSYSAPQEVIDSLESNVILKQEQVESDGITLKSPGLRAPQIAAIHSVLSHLAVSSDAITIVLPTGTGKTETILGTIAIKRLKRSLIIVPSDGLRNQFFSGSVTWGILKKIGIIKLGALNPIVSKLVSSIKDRSTFERLITSSNIVIATASILNNLTGEFLNILNNNVDVVFIDEAHHSAAPTWEAIKSLLPSPQIIQFTATPFREDGRPIKGKIAFNYSLEDAQKNKFFTKIDFIPVVDYDEDHCDQTISEKAIEVLRKDIAAGKNHILMARVDNVIKAEEIFKTYYQNYTEFNPVLITSKSKASDKLIDKLRKGQSKIVVCVNMLGEGIDIPELKIAALHDIRKSLTVTLQFIGRFTRSSKTNDSAKIIANIADVKIEKRLKQLYKEDADWGKLVAFSSAKEIQKKIKFQETLANFKDSKIPLFNIKPKLSAVVYKTKKNSWKPEHLEKHLEENEDLFLCDINHQDNLAIAIYQIDENIDWLDSKVFTETSWELLLFYFDNKNQLLYVNSSQKNVDQTLVDKLIDVDYRFDREFPFKCYEGLGYVILYTLGIDKNTDSPIKYAMYAGSDIYDGITDMEKNKSSKSNTYGLGFKDGEEVTLGASKNGKIWSRLIGNIQEWREWCDEIGKKLEDASIDVDKIFKGFLQPKRFDISKFPALSNPTSIDFPSSFYQEMESIQTIIIDGTGYQLNEITLFINKNSDGYKIDFITPDETFTLNLIYSGDSFDYAPQNFKSIVYKKKSKSKDLLPYLKDEDGFRIRLIDGTFVENNYHFQAYNPESIFSLNTSLLTSLDWSGVDISKESRNVIAPFELDSIQEKIYKIKNATKLFSVIINDDEPGEAGDLLCFGLDDDRLLIEVIHCKFKLNKDPLGSRAKDFYELCCQAQKGVKQIPNVLRLFDHIKERELKVNRRGGTRFLKGDMKSLEVLIKSNSYKRPKIKIVLVQPGLQKTVASKPVLELLGSTYTLLKETLNAEFEVLCS